MFTIFIATKIKL